MKEIWEFFKALILHKIRRAVWTNFWISPKAEYLHKAEAYIYAPELTARLNKQQPFYLLISAGSFAAPPESWTATYPHITSS